jgi:hypothetical protein
VSLTASLSASLVFALLTGVCSAQTTPISPAGQGTSAASSAANGQQSQPEEAPQTEKHTSQKKTKRGEIVLAPIPISSPAIGTGIVPVIAYIFALSENDKVSPPSAVAAGGIATNNGTRAFGVGGSFYLKQDAYRVTAGFVHGNINYDLYGIGTAAGNANQKLPLEQTGEIFLGQALRRIGWDFFLGPRFLTGHSLITVRSDAESPVPIPPDTGLQTTLRAIGVELSRDTRPNRFYPTSGMFFDFISDFYSQELGSKFSFQSYGVTFNKYKSLNEKQVVAFNAYFCGTGGDPPFYGNCIYGTNNELRGYTAGQYLDRYMVATQAEYRLALPKRFGVVAFAGIGEVIPGAGQLFRSSNFLPAGGGGLRFMVSKKYHVNLRADFAEGKDGHTLGLGIGEAF